MREYSEAIGLWLKRGIKKAESRWMACLTV